jgi:hypothetical protein
MAAKKARGSWDSDDKRTKAGRDTRAYHPHKDTDAFFNLVGGALSGAKNKVKSSAKSSKTSSSKSSSSRPKLTQKMIDDAIREEEEEMARLKEAREAKRLAKEEERERRRIAKLNAPPTKWYSSIPTLCVLTVLFFPLGFYGWYLRSKE